MAESSSEGGTPTKAKAEERMRNYLDHFKNLLDPAQRHLTDMTKPYNRAFPFPKDVHVNPADLKKLVLNSERIRNVLEKESGGDPRKKAELVRTVKTILDEIGLDESLAVIRVLGTILNYIIRRILSGMYVNETKLEQLKSQFGDRTVLYLPSHRSYGDFILMSYVSFCYNIAIPGIAAGMDFHSMAFMGSILRQTGAFYMRRTFGNDQLYWAVFKEYMRQLVRAYDNGVEFFIEGTRSRSNKALTPKIGLLSMALEPLFMGEVPDVLVVPVSVSYDRPLEEQLFVYELLGVPKPKESTKGLLKAMSILKENYGSIYFEFGDPISVREYFGDELNRFQHSMSPAHVQSLTKSDLTLLHNLAFDVVHLQQEKIVLTTFHLISVYYNYRKYLGQSVNLPELIEGLRVLVDIFQHLGAVTTIQKTGHHEADRNLIRTSIEEALKTHANILQLNSDAVLVIAKSHHDFSQVDKRKLKGHNLSDVVMRLSVPIFTLQLYCNPCLHWLAQPALVLLAAKNLSNSSSDINVHTLRQTVIELRNLFATEFVFHGRREEREFGQSLDHLVHFGVMERGTVVEDGPAVVRIVQDKADQQQQRQQVYLSAVGPFLCCYLQVAVVLMEHFSHGPFKEKDYLAKVKEFKSINLALYSLVALGVIAKTKLADLTTSFTVDTARLRPLVATLRTYCDLLPFEYLTFQGAVVQLVRLVLAIVLRLVHGMLRLLRTVGMRTLGQAAAAAIRWR
ncbi:glycerol-3-phosphate acyltransferase [Culex quinquefasciatus]|uniref:Glycerol-3-phosphate acyltransferase n=1 Tax=Culex quinquefasciatus TaxID=7176 RepID=B0XKM6_CULQU|nr:glycerol-3-phosphate acyltransferase [Culex quinquefasciatus]|eukprot:XP_001870198.1 glycerol-3-phosphate acyltransferase [Culex quinquefasciatus]